MRVPLLLTTLAFATAAHAQWTIQDAHTTASLRGIHSLGHGIAWASGTEGTVLHTEDNGAHWQHCATPPNAEKLDFRGIQAFDNKTAIVMSSGKGDLSRLYKTTDGCQTWKLILTNPDKDGFWDALIFEDRTTGFLLGDPVHGSFYLSETTDSGKTWIQKHNRALQAEPSLQGAFAASNTSMSVMRESLSFGSGGVGGAFLYRLAPQSSVKVPLGSTTEASGLFSLTLQPTGAGIAVGGDYLKPNDSTRTTAYTTDGGQTWTPSTTPPHGYRSAVAYDTPTKTWITVGPNGTDISTDDGRNWHALTPAPTDTPDADKNWNALSLPFVVGPHGRIGLLRDDALAPHK
jgi:photosystem II stability/assembly factor-like uncharacterized protein